MEVFHVTEWGPPKLREIHKEIEGAINARTPVGGLGTECDEGPNGAQINTKVAPGVTDDQKGGGAGGGSSGTPRDIVGAFNAQPATYHLLESSAPTPLVP